MSAVKTIQLNNGSNLKSVFSKIAHILDLVKISKERFVLPDYNAVVMNLDDYEDMLFMSNPKIQKEIKEDLAEYEKTKGIDYLEYRKKRFQKRV
ncbi:hypothetical protein KKA09_00990 [Patescibacteria group bacterium]|nr:hypothetical protein [Patescibacteria group bacterium]